MTATSVLLPIIRRVMPSIIANSIIGVSPMTGPAGSIFDMYKTWKFPPRVVMTKVHYRHFLRVYNRRIHHLPAYITGLGYQTIQLRAVRDRHIEAEEWCRENLKPGSYVRRHSNFWFAYDADAVLFKMHWL